MTFTLSITKKELRILFEKEENLEDFLAFFDDIAKAAQSHNTTREMIFQYDYELTEAIKNKIIEEVENGIQR